jgi:hypothetical protein
MLEEVVELTLTDKPNFSSQGSEINRLAMLLAVALAREQQPIIASRYLIHRVVL